MTRNSGPRHLCQHCNVKQPGRHFSRHLAECLSSSYERAESRSAPPAAVFDASINTAARFSDQTSLLPGAANSVDSGTASLPAAPRVSEYIQIAAQLRLGRRPAAPDRPVSLLRDGVLYADVVRSHEARPGFQSLELMVSRLEEEAVTCRRGDGRADFLRKLLAPLNSIHRLPLPDREKPLHTHGLVAYIDRDSKMRPVNIFGAFLNSLAFELICLSYILEAPDEDENKLLLELFRICLCRTQCYSSIVSAVHDLAQAFSEYEDKDAVIVKRKELIQFIQGIARLKAENAISAQVISDFASTTKLEQYLLRKHQMVSEDSLEIHSEKIRKLTSLENGLAFSIMKVQKIIPDAGNCNSFPGKL